MAKLKDVKVKELKNELESYGLIDAQHAILVYMQ